MIRFIAFVVFLILVGIFISVRGAEAREVLPGPVQGQVIAVLDGDTVTARLHVWIGQEIETHVRIYGIDAPEMKGKCTSERTRAAAAKKALAAMVAEGKISLSNIQLEKYAGRVMAKISTYDGRDVGSALLVQGFVRPYHGEKRLGWCSQAAN